MNSRATRADDRRDPRAGRTLVVGALWLAWQAIRLPISATLIVLEPVVRFILTAATLLGILMAFFFKLSRAAPHFPFWGMLGFSVGCAVLLMAYHAIVRLFSR
jgi:hypothetical protein